MRLTLSLCKYLGKGPRRADPLRRRRTDIVFNNRWQIGRELKVTDPGYKDACLEKGIPVYKPEDIFTSHLPPKQQIDFNFDDVQTIKRPFKNQEEHPYYHERQAYLFNGASKFQKKIALDHAKVLFNFSSKTILEARSFCLPPVSSPILSTT